MAFGRLIEKSIFLCSKKHIWTQKVWQHWHSYRVVLLHPGRCRWHHVRVEGEQLSPPGAVAAAVVVAGGRGRAPPADVLSQAAPSSSEVSIGAVSPVGAAPTVDPSSSEARPAPEVVTLIPSSQDLPN